ncbi:pentapeptide repeat-containing protein [Rhodococcus tukisamuensis]|uniref:pentapeptide repeat-containing protein n=1 Tax=Rhodococcus tukisamuensis TaxID=168276 RepID=UPI001C316954
MTDQHDVERCSEDRSAVRGHPVLPDRRCLRRQRRGKCAGIVRGDLPGGRAAERDGHRRTRRAALTGRGQLLAWRHHGGAEQQTLVGRRGRRSRRDRDGDRGQRGRAAGDGRRSLDRGALPRLGLAGLDLTGLDLTRLDLTRLDLTGLDLTGLDLTRLDLTGLDLTGLDLTARRAQRRILGADLHRWRHAVRLATDRWRHAVRLARDRRRHAVRLACDRRRHAVRLARDRRRPTAVRLTVGNARRRTYDLGRIHRSTRHQVRVAPRNLDVGHGSGVGDSVIWHRSRVRHPVVGHGPQIGRLTVDCLVAPRQLLPLQYPRARHARTGIRSSHRG